MKSFVHPSAEVSPHAHIGDNTNVWNWAQIRGGAVVGADTIVGKSVYIDADVVVGNRVKIQNNVSIYKGVVIEDGVFVGPHVCFTNDRHPRAINPDGTPKGSDDWELSETRIKYGAALGANSTIVAGVTIGRFALVAAGSVVTHDVPDYSLVIGVPARIAGTVCECGRLIDRSATPLRGDSDASQCDDCHAARRKTAVSDIPSQARG